MTSMPQNQSRFQVVPYPVLFNAWKHHAGWVRQRIAVAASGGEDGLKQLADAVVVCGTKLMDFYHGSLTPWAVGEAALAHLHQLGKTEFPVYRVWLESQGGFSGFAAPDDSRWILRAGDESDRYVHLHPGRYSPHTIRVPGITLKTAIVTLALAQQTNADPLAVAVVNDARKRFLALPPMAAVDPANGLGEVIRVLAG